MLDELGEKLIKAHSGIEALEHLLKNDIALVLMDVSMPGMDGFETAHMIHGHPRFHTMTSFELAQVCILRVLVFPNEVNPIPFNGIKLRYSRVDQCQESQ